MKRLGIYFSLQFKRTLKCLPVILCVSAILFLTLGIILTGIIDTDANSEDKQKFRVGIVGDTSESYLGLGIAAVETLDSSRFAMDFLEMTENEAKRMLEAGKLSAYVVVPEGFVDSAIRGDIKKITYVTSPGAAGLSTVLKNEIAEFISEVLIHSQKGVYAAGEAMRDEGVENRSDTMDDLAVEYFTFILNRSKLYSTDIMGVSDTLSLGGYFLCGISVFFLFMWGISCCFLFTRRDISLSGVLCAKGSSSLVQVIGEYLAYLVLMLMTVFIIILAILPFSAQMSAFIPELDGADISWFVSFAFSLIPCTVMIASIQFLLYEAVSGIAAGVLAQFISAITLSYTGGCLYPISFFPKVMVKLSSVLPGGLARGYLTSFIAGENTFPQLLGMMIWFAAVFALTVMTRSMRVRRDR